MSDKPDITHAQIAAPTTALVGVLAVVYQAPERLQPLLIIVIGAVAAVWIASDAFLRGKRNESAAAVTNQVTAQIRGLLVEGDDSKVPPTFTASAPSPSPHATTSQPPVTS